MFSVDPDILFVVWWVVGLRRHSEKNNVCQVSSPTSPHILFLPSITGVGATPARKRMARDLEGVKGRKRGGGAGSSREAGTNGSLWGPRSHRTGTSRIVPLGSTYLIKSSKDIFIRIRRGYQAMSPLTASTFFVVDIVLSTALRPWGWLWGHPYTQLVSVPSPFHPFGHFSALSPVCSSSCCTRYVQAFRTLEIDGYLCCRIALPIRRRPYHQVLILC